jgi:ribonucleoside-triphosphate reductase
MSRWPWCHEPVVIWAGPRLGIWITALVATAGTIAASWVDHRVFGRGIARWWSAAGHDGGTSLLARLTALFHRAPFAVVAGSGLTPLPFLPFKVLAFGAGYPLGPYLAAVATGRFPRYVLLAWLGAALRIPTWLVVAASLVLLIPLFKELEWRRPWRARNAS